MAENKKVIENTFGFTRPQYEELAFEMEYPGTSIDTICGIMWLDKVYSDEAIKSVLKLQIQHEQVLRIGICQINDVYRQYELPYEQCFIEVIDYGDVDKKTLLSRFTELAQKSLFAEYKPLYEFKIFHYGSRMGVIYLMHHLIADGATLGLIAIRTVQALEKLAVNELPEFENHSFAEIVARKAAAEKSEKHLEDRKFWQERYRNWQGTAKIKPCADVADNDDAMAGRIKKIITGELADKINAVCDSHKFMPNIVFTAALLIYLKQQNPQLSRIDIGQNLLGRRNSVERETLGMFSIELPLCTEISYDMNVEELYEAVKLSNRQSYRHQLCMHDEILEIAREIQPELMALRDVEFSYQPCMDMRANNFYGEWISCLATETSVEFSVSNLNSKDEFVVTFDYRIKVFNETEAENVLDKIIVILKWCIENPQQLIGKLL